jgi:hypothetical protein
MLKANATTDLPLPIWQSDLEVKKMERGNGVPSDSDGADRDEFGHMFVSDISSNHVEVIENSVSEGGFFFRNCVFELTNNSVVLRFYANHNIYSFFFWLTASTSRRVFWVQLVAVMV